MVQGCVALWRTPGPRFAANDNGLGSARPLTPLIKYSQVITDCYVMAAALKSSTSISFARSCARHRSQAVCIPSHVSGVGPNAWDRRMDISTDTPTFSFTRSDSA